MTAENESWYLNGEPVAHAGNLYYPAGAQRHFNPNEMVRSGFHLGIPLYTRTTIEPFSVVYVPVAGGLMQPYERLRDRELTGTQGSTPPTLITPYNPDSAAGLLPQSPAPPSRPPIVLPRDAQDAVMGPVGVAGQESSRPVVAAAERPVGTTGPARSRRPMHTRIGDRPTGINAIFIEFENRRWYSTGASIEIDPTRMQRSGEYHGFDVWTRGQGDPLIYVSVAKGGTLAVPYSAKRPPARRR